MKQKLISMFCCIIVLASFGVIDVFAGGGGSGITPDQALAMLQEGNLRFVNGQATYPHQDAARRIDTFVNGQHPFATIIGCSDSRVPIELVFDQGIGDTFIIRVAGNVIDIDEAGSVEYGVDHLVTPIFVVLGHRNCGACTAVATGAELHGNIPPLVDNIIPAVDKVKAEKPWLVGDEYIAEVVKQNVWQAIEDLFTISPISVSRIHAGDLKVVGAIYDIESGIVEWLGEHPEQSVLIPPPTPIVTVTPTPTFTATPIVTPGSYPAWTSSAIYNAGDIVSHNGLNWQAGWWTTGEEPGTTGEWGVWQEL